MSPKYYNYASIKISEFKSEAGVKSFSLRNSATAPVPVPA
jgi:hypothetical protein